MNDIMILMHACMHALHCSTLGDAQGSLPFTEVRSGRRAVAAMIMKLLMGVMLISCVSGGLQMHTGLAILGGQSSLSRALKLLTI